MGTAFNPAKTSPASWDAFADVDAFVDEVLAELAAMEADGTLDALAEESLGVSLTDSAARVPVLRTGGP